MTCWLVLLEMFLLVFEDYSLIVGSGGVCMVMKCIYDESGVGRMGLGGKLCKI